MNAVQKVVFMNSSLFDGLSPTINQLINIDLEL